MNYILYLDNTFMHFFCSGVQGLVLKTKKDGHWSKSITICQEVLPGFCVFLDKDKQIHILCTNKNNDILYITQKNRLWQKYVLSKGNPEIFPIQFKIAQTGNLLNFFYTANFRDDTILVHCILGDNAKPEILDSLYTDCPQFSVNLGKVYYTNKEKVLGYRDFSDGKPGEFSKTEEDALFPYSVTINAKEYLLYLKNTFIYLNGEKIFSDSLCRSPIISARDNKLTIQWKSNSFVRYLTSFNNGATWSSPMRFIGSGGVITSFCIEDGNDAHICYGQNLNPEPVIYGKTNLFFFEAPSPQTFTKGEFNSDEYRKLRILVDMQRKEIKTLKSKIKKLENSD